MSLKVLLFKQIPYKFLPSRNIEPKDIDIKALLLKQNLVISIQVNNLSESGGSPHQPQSTLIETKSGHFHTSKQPLGIWSLPTSTSKHLYTNKIWPFSYKSLPSRNLESDHMSIKVPLINQILVFSI